MVGKPLYGLVSDSVYISGQHRVPYIAFGVAYAVVVAVIAIAVIAVAATCITAIAA
ncbi:putative folate-biopterin transporter 7-like [Trifolium medium]|uniref:Putative folate-biopterin transporter 7-like n=1 Tax=Trifolium medium TaxID=97028 RepID=A0A392NEM7_9FABA|nr:putative folate-biopterin transporter 7-like [Trifolium medium]